VQQTFIFGQLRELFIFHLSFEISHLSLIFWKTAEMKNLKWKMENGFSLPYGGVTPPARAGGFTVTAGIFWSRTS